MSDLFMTQEELDRENCDTEELIIPTSFKDALSYAQQILWLYIHKQDKLVEGDNITLTSNPDGTVTISASGSSGSTYRIDEVEPSGDNVRAYALIDVDTETQVGDTIEIPAIAGPQGPQGEPGPQGPQGIQGETGPQGPQGIQGETGPQGIQGETGPAGPAGATGPQGPAGNDGVSPTVTVSSITGGHRVEIVSASGTDQFDVMDGTDGAQGPAGPQGIQGETGPQGPQGIQGETGPAGATGATGPQGPTGATGPQGPAGNDGVSPSITVTSITGGHRVEIVSASGTDQFDILDGTDGAPGAQGPAGADGVGIASIVAGTPVTKSLTASHYEGSTVDHTDTIVVPRYCDYTVTYTNGTTGTIRVYAGASRFIYSYYHDIDVTPNVTYLFYATYNPATDTTTEEQTAGVTISDGAGGSGGSLDVAELLIPASRSSSSSDRWPNEPTWTTSSLISGMSNVAIQRGSAFEAIVALLGNALSMLSSSLSLRFTFSNGTGITISTGSTTLMNMRLSGLSDSKYWTAYGSTLFNTYQSGRSKDMYGVAKIYSSSGTLLGKFPVRVQATCSYGRLDLYIYITAGSVSAIAGATGSFECIIEAH